MNPLFSKLREAFDRLTLQQKVQIGAAVLVTFGIVWAITSYANRARYEVLFTRLERSDAASIVEQLRERQVPYRLSAGGTALEVPVGRSDELRIDMAGEGLPAGEGAGFEMFDKPAFGLSDFVQNVNYRRALERELARTIQSLDSVDRARVHLALPPETVFAEERREPSASVVVKLRAGHALANDRVRAISHLVAFGVEGLQADNVSVIDADGRMFAMATESKDQLSPSQLEAKASMERQIESNLVAILEPIVGRGKINARATVDLNMRRIERIEESYDPASAVVRSEEKSKQKSRDASGGGGIPGTASNLPGAAGGGGGSGTQQESQTTVTNFEINKTVSTISEPVGALQKQSIAVVVDNAAPGEDAADDGSATSEPRSQEDMQKLTEIVRASIGFDAARGDTLTVENIAFNTTSVPGTDGGFDVVGLLLTILRYASLPLAVLFLALLVIRPGIAAVRSLREGDAQPSEGHPPTVAQLQAQVRAQLGPGDGITEGSPLRKKLMEAVTEDPHTAALVVRNWIERTEKA